MEAGIYLLLAGSTPAQAVRFDGTTRTFASAAGTAYIFPSSPTTPTWVAEVSRLWPTVGQVNLSSARSGCVIAVQAGRREFLISLGSGHLKIDRKHVVHDFGRRAALNGVRPDTLKQVARQALEGNFIHAIEQAAKSGSVSQFGIDVERDLLQGIFGKTRKRAFGNYIGGATSLRVSIEGGLPSIISRLKLFLRLYEQKIREKSFSWYERITLVQDAAQIDALNAQLDRQIISGGAEVLLALPKVLEGTEHIAAFRFEEPTARRPVNSYPDPEFVDWVDWRRTKHKSIDLASTESTYLYVDFDSGETSRSPISDSLLWETTDAGSGVVHVRNDGGWYRIDPSFVQDVDTYVRGIGSSGLALPAYMGGIEAVYNRALAASVPGSYLLDGQNVTLPGANSSIEPCDVYWLDAATTTGRLFFVKRKRVGSSGLSHLFAQVLVGVDAFFHQDPAMRHAIEARLVGAGATLGFPATSRPDGQRWQACIVICQQQRKTRVLPFLCKITLKRVAETLTNRYGVRVVMDVA